MKIILGILLIFFILANLITAKSGPEVASSSPSLTPSPSVSPTPEKIDPPAPSGSPAEMLTPEPSTTTVDDADLVRVVNVVDGDTVKIETGETVRYIGIDTPESVHPAKALQCFAKEASDKNTELVEGKLVRLEKDISEKDRYGRLLRYIWLGEELVNEILIREGYAYSYTYQPDVKYQERFMEAQRLAREEQKGLWGSACEIQPTPVTTSEPGGDASLYICDCSKSCAKMTSCAEAQFQLVNCGCTGRDGDGDGFACDSDCQ
ncbi:MAG: nuclease [Candidatus Gottesmanbacteria bacterium GW2011_GWA2_43_14]|uniref:Nuclease n=1 Tax=Candidatus Gottesmanbacteria bacterium GW2011_GWA2_43_14 TaxID=1618443 RepID=A0A0G1FLR3_9BACT|nr:MAG: nuclease [Candidatus Gottesmanbacteria bacterium GW2011_GWA2_43_14]